MGTLFEEWLCINWAKVEQQRLTWHREHQKVLRGDLYQGLQDAVTSGRHDPQPSIHLLFFGPIHISCMIVPRGSSGHIMRGVHQKDLFLFI